MERKPVAPSAVRIGAVVLAAGRSTRMGVPKMAMPWKETNVIGRVVSALGQGGADEVVVVTGGDRAAVEAALRGLPVRMAHNPRYAEDAMLLTLQMGLRALGENVQAALVALGDQPQIEADTVRRVIAAYRSRRSGLVAPSYRLRRGHPWLVDRALWADLLDREPPETPRSFLNDQADRIEYVVVETDSILRDLDTPEDYRREAGGDSG